MSLSPQNTSISLPARLLLYLGPPSAILLTYTASPKAALVSPLTFLPAAYFLRKWRQSKALNPSRRGELEPLIWTFMTAGTLGLTTVAGIQIIICKAASAALFGTKTQMSKDFWAEFQRGTIEGMTGAELTRRAELAASWQAWVFNGILTFVCAGLVEETLKYLPIVYAHWRGKEEQGRRRDRAYIDYALAGALSFGLVENLGFLYAACETGRESWPKLLLTLFERLVIGQIGHLSVAALTALRAIRRDYYGDQLSWWGVVGPAALYHGTFDFVAMSASALEGNVGWIHPSGVRLTAAILGLAVGLVGSASWQVRQEWKALDGRDRTGKTLKDDSTQK